MFDQKLEITLNDTFNFAKERRHDLITLEHLLLCLLDNEQARDVLLACQTNINRVRSQLQSYLNETSVSIKEQDEHVGQPTMAFQRVLQRAIFQAQSSGLSEVNGAHVLIAIMHEDDSQAKGILVIEGVDKTDMIGCLTRSMDVAKPSENPSPNFYGPCQDSVVEMPLEEGSVEQYTINLNEQVMKGFVDRLIGRQAELRRCIQVLCRRNKNNPLFIGEPGVGKTAIAQAVAWNIVHKDVPKILEDHVVYELDMGALLAGTKYRGDFEKRFKAVLKAFSTLEKSIVFIDEIHSLVGAGSASGGAIDAANLIKPLLTRSSVRFMGATTYQEYRNVFGKDAALSRRFQKIDVKEPSTEETLEIITGIKEYYEKFHNVTYTKEALKASVDLSARYLNDRFLPDKAIDILDESGAMHTMTMDRKKREIKVKDVEKTVASVARIPSKQVSASDAKLLRNLDRSLHDLVYGQDEAISALTSSVQLSRSGLRDPGKPIGCFLLAGPTGVGKTEISKQLARIQCVKLLRYDMSEYMESHSVSQLIGAPAGYVGFDQGGLLTDSIIKNPHAVLLLDEIEKAHADIFNILLQVMDHGALTDNNGRVADFRNVTLIMTTNAGASDLAKHSIGFSDEVNESETDASNEVNRLFSPEFRNRLDAIIYFKRLDMPAVNKVVDKFLAELRALLSEKGVKLEVTGSAKAWLGKNGFDATMGARPMSRLIETTIKRPLAKQLLFGKLKKGGHAKVSMENGKLKIAV